MTSGAWRRLGLLLAASALGLMAPRGAAAQVPEDTAALRWVDDFRGRLFGDSSAFFPVRVANTEARRYLHLQPRDTVPMLWRRGLIFTPLFGGQQSIGFEVGASYSLPRLGTPPPQTAELRASVRWGITGSRDGTLKFNAPGWIPNWKFLAMVRAERLMRSPYFGEANQETVQDSLTDLYGTIYYRYALVRTTIFGTVARRLVGPVWLQAGFQQRWYRSSALGGTTTLFGNDVAAGILPDTSTFRGTEGRIGILIDTRDYWDAPESGIFFEAIAAAGELSNHRTGTLHPYSRYLFAAREYVRIAPRATIALRQQSVLASDTLPFFLAYEQLTSGLPDDGIIGPRGIRLHGSANQLASNQTFFSFDLRYKLFNFREDPIVPLRIWLIGFADYGTLWEPNQDQTTFHYQWSLGTGVRLQLHKASMIGFDVGVTELGGELNVLTYFSF